MSGDSWSGDSDWSEAADWQESGYWIGSNYVYPAADSKGKGKGKGKAKGKDKGQQDSYYQDDSWREEPQNSRERRLVSRDIARLLTEVPATSSSGPAVESLATLLVRASQMMNQSEAPAPLAVPAPVPVANPAPVPVANPAAVPVANPAAFPVAPPGTPPPGAMAPAAGAPATPGLVGGPIPDGGPPAVPPGAKPPVILTPAAKEAAFKNRPAHMVTPAADINKLQKAR